MDNIVINYSWDMDFFKKEYNKIINILSKETLTEKQVDEYNYELDVLELIFNTIEENSCSKLPYLFFRKEEIKDEVKRTIFKKTNNFQRNIIIESSKIFKSMKTDSINYKYLEKSLPLSVQIELIYKFFGFTEDLKRAHATLFNPLSRQYQIFNAKEKNAFIFYNNTGYIANKNNQTLYDFCNLCHETGHYDEVIITNNRLAFEYDKKHNHKIWLYVEVYSIFYELISVYYLNKEKIINARRAR